MAQSKNSGVTSFDFEQITFPEISNLAKGSKKQVSTDIPDKAGYKLIMVIPVHSGDDDFAMSGIMLNGNRASMQVTNVGTTADGGTPRGLAVYRRGG